RSYDRACERSASERCVPVERPRTAAARTSRALRDGDARQRRDARLHRRRGTLRPCALRLRRFGRRIRGGLRARARARPWLVGRSRPPASARDLRARRQPRVLIPRPRWTSARGADARRVIGTRPPRHAGGFRLADRCCSPRQGGDLSRFRSILWLALLVNAAMFAVEVAAARVADSVSLLADSI